MKKDVVNEVFRRIANGSEHFGYLFGKGSKVFVFSALGGHGGKVAFKNQSRFPHLPGLKAMKGSHKAKVGFGKLGRPLGDKSSYPVLHRHYSHGSHIADSGA